MFGSHSRLRNGSYLIFAQNIFYKRKKFEMQNFNNFILNIFQNGSIIVHLNLKFMLCREAVIQVRIYFK